MEKQKSPKILISGCGMSFGKGERPTWVKILKICGLDIVDLTGPGISNTTITNSIIEELYKNDYSHVIVQITNPGKLDVELTDERKKIMEQDPLRNYSWNGIWPSSVSDHHISKKNYYKYLHSPISEEKDLLLKLMHIQDICKSKKIKLLIFKGLRYDFKDPLANNIDMLENFDMDTDYMQSNHTHDSQVSITPIKAYQIEFAKKINEIFLKLDIPKLNKF